MDQYGLFRGLYLDALDPVRTQGDKAYSNSNQLIGKMALISSLITGNCPVLSQSQCFDSLTIVEAFFDSGFQELIRKGYIRTTWFGKEGIPLDALRENLKKGLEDGQDFFVFSAFPSLNEPGDSRKLKQDKRRSCLEWMERGCLGEGRYYLGQPDADRLQRFYESNKQLEHDIKLYHSQVTRHPVPLSGYVSQMIENCQRLTNPASVETAAQLQKLQQVMNQEKPESKNNRSAYYTYIDQLDVGNTVKQELRTIIDCQYNKVVGGSVMGNLGNIELTRVCGQNDPNHEIFEVMFSETSQDLGISYTELEENTGSENLTWGDVLMITGALHTIVSEAEAAGEDGQFVSRKIEELYRSTLKERLISAGIRGGRLLAAFLDGHPILANILVTQAVDSVTGTMKSKGIELATLLPSASIVTQIVNSGLHRMINSATGREIQHTREVKGIMKREWEKGRENE